MIRPSLLIVSLIIVLCEPKYSLGEPTSQRVEKCRQYSEKVFGTESPKCNDHDEIRGDYTALSITDYPYMAALGKLDDDNETYTWVCHGTLVSSRYVLTTGHCSRNFDISRTKVRLGALSLLNDDKTILSDFDIEEIMVHPDFNNKYNDIGLLKLSKKVEFSQDIRPICLPELDETSSNVYKLTYYRWLDESSSRPLVINDVEPVTNERCNETYSKLYSRQVKFGITDDFMCFINNNDLAESKGESGAPIQINHPQIACSHIQLGISSFGVSGANTIPQVAVRVSSYFDWIQNIIWSDEESV